MDAQPSGNARTRLPLVNVAHREFLTENRVRGRGELSHRLPWLVKEPKRIRYYKQ